MTTKISNYPPLNVQQLKSKSANMESKLCLLLFIFTLYSLENVVCGLSAESVFEMLSYSISHISDRVGNIESDFEKLKDRIDNLETIVKNVDIVTEHSEENYKELKKDINEQFLVGYKMLTMEKENVRKKIEHFNENFVELTTELRTEINAMRANFSQEFLAAKTTVEIIADKALNISYNTVESTKTSSSEIREDLNSTVEVLKSDLQHGLLNTKEWFQKSLQSQKVSHYGTSFVTGFMDRKDNEIGTPTLMFACPESVANVKISIPFLNIVNEQHILAGGTLTLTFSYEVSSRRSGNIEDKGVYVSADRQIAMYAGNFKTSGSSDGSLVLPVTSLGNDYVIASYPSTSAGSEEFLIVATENATLVTVTINSVSQTMTLNQYQTYFHKATHLTGSRIKASAPVYVLSGHQCANIPDATTLYCDYIEEAMPPITALGTDYVISFMKPRPDYTVGIVALSPGTDVVIYDAAGDLIEHIDDTVMLIPQFRTFIDSKTILITSTRPVLVTQYGHGSALTGGDPSMMVIPDVAHFGHAYDFVVPTYFDDSNTLAVVISSSSPSSGLVLNGLPFMPTETVSVGGKYKVLYANVSVGYNRVYHTDENSATFGAWIYGFSTNQEYSWALGYT